MPVPTRTSADANSSADINTLQSQITGGLGFDFRSTGTNATLTSAEANSRLYYTLSANINITLDDDFSEGNFVEIHLSTAAYKVTLKSQDGDTICTMIPGSWLVIVATQAAPTDATHWKTMDAGGRWVAAGVVAGDYTGFGTVSSITSYCRRVGDSLEVRVKGTTGTNTATEGRIAHPFGLSSPSTVIGVEPCGRVSSDGTLSGDLRDVICGVEASTTYVVFMFESGGHNSYTKLNGSDLGGTSVMYLRYVTPVSGWEIG